mmetsp:Transcript_7020/g.19778  ORF Transcript_7020/g.19778 Transcript_7020/m.19778 type:complete len:317 (+) Transcript_7020:1846-2796(+)
MDLLVDLGCFPGHILTCLGGSHAIVDKRIGLKLEGVPLAIDDLGLALEAAQLVLHTGQDALEFARFSILLLEGLFHQGIALIELVECSLVLDDKVLCLLEAVLLADFALNEALTLVLDFLRALLEALDLGQNRAALLLLLLDRREHRLVGLVAALQGDERAVPLRDDLALFEDGAVHFLGSLAQRLFRGGGFLLLRNALCLDERNLLLELGDALNALVDLQVLLGLFLFELGHGLLRLVRRAPHHGDFPARLFQELLDLLDSGLGGVLLLLGGLEFVLHMPHFAPVVLQQLLLLLQLALRAGPSNGGVLKGLVALL